MMVALPAWVSFVLLSVNALAASSPHHEQPRRNVDDITSFSSSSSSPASLASSPLAQRGEPPARPAKRTYHSHSYYVVELSPRSRLTPHEAARRLGAEMVERVGELDHHWLVRVADGGHEKRALRGGGEDSVLSQWAKKRSTEAASEGGLKGVRSVERMVPRQRVKRAWEEPAESLSFRQLADQSPAEDLTEFNILRDKAGLNIQDPLLPQQWHIVNTQIPDNEMNVTGVWQRGITGKGVHVCLVDDGLDMTSGDLKDNFYAEGSYDFNDHTPLPKPRLSDDTHGTRCAGEIAAAPNDVCGVGIAYTTSIAGVRILSAPISDADEAAALNFAYQTNDIYSCSWGPPDDGRNMDAPYGLILKAFVNGIQKGRGGKGSIFVFAAGNGGGAEDQCNFDGYTNSIYSMTIGAVDRKGLHPYYSEKCSAVLAVAYSSGSGDAIHTTDVGENRCTGGHGGTSAAAPLGAGMMALALQVRPDLTWRDAQHLVVNAVELFNADDPEWETTHAGRKFNYKYGYGKLNAGKLIEVAEKWKLVKPQAWYNSKKVTLTPVQSSSRRQNTEPVPVDGVPTPTEPATTTTAAPAATSSTSAKPKGLFISAEGIEVVHTVTAEALKAANFERLEHVTVQVWVEHGRRGDVEFELVSPNGIRSVLATERRYDDADTGYPGWKFMSMKHWDEPAVGDWTLKVHDKVNPDKNGTLDAWELMLWGEAADASKAKLYKLPTSEDGSEDEEEELPVSSSIAPLPIPTPGEGSVTKAFPKPTDHLPDDHISAPGEGPTPTANASKTPGSTVDEGMFDGISSLASGSGRWALGALFVVFLAGAAGGVFFWLRNRRRRSAGFGSVDHAAAGEYGIVPGEEDDVSLGLMGRSRGQSRRGGGAKTKELYDAFGDASDDSLDDDDDEGAALRYHDSFLDDDDHDPRAPGPSRTSSTAASPPPPAGAGASSSSSAGAYHDEHGDDQPPREPAPQQQQQQQQQEEEAEPASRARETPPSRDSGDGSGGSGGSGSWQDVHREG